MPLPPYASKLVLLVSASAGRAASEPTSSAPASPAIPMVPALSNPARESRLSCFRDRRSAGGGAFPLSSLASRAAILSRCSQTTCHNSSTVGAFVSTLILPWRYASLRWSYRIVSDRQGQWG